MMAGQTVIITVLTTQKHKNTNEKKRKKKKPNINEIITAFPAISGNNRTKMKAEKNERKKT